MQYKTAQVYILTNKNNTVLYTGVTNDLIRRIQEHKQKLNPKSFTARYNVDKLVWFENYLYRLEIEMSLKFATLYKSLQISVGINKSSF